MLTWPAEGSTQDPEHGAKDKLMMRFFALVIFVCGLCAVMAEPAAAQATWADRGYINVGWGVESGSSAMSDTRTSLIYEESATVTSSSTFTSGSLFDVGFGLRVFRNMVIGAAYHQEQNDTDGTITGSIPSPIFFNRPRSVTETIAGLDRKEQATHLNIGWVLPFSEKIDVMVYGGPSFFRITQDAITDVRFGEQGGAFTSLVVTPTITERKKSVTGYNVGADATYIVWSNDSIRVGAGGFVRFSQASTDIDMLTTAQPTDVGGVQFGFGARLRF